jgi:CPA2 family monovalent cation:H+ antiporter-2
VAFLTAEAGLSLALGAFLAGLVISESEYSHQATSVILPFRELFTSFFFISVGMLLDLQFFWGNIGIVMLIVVAVFFIKSIIAALAIAVLKYPPRTFLLTGLALFQVGEFAFILSKVGIQYDLLAPETNQYFLAISIVSMLLTPFVIIFSERIAFGLMKFRPIEAWDRKMVASKERDHSVATDQLHNHLVIIGYGINGSNLARAAEFSDIPYVAVEMNAETVKAEQKKGVPILYGDARQDHIMEAVNIPKARVVVIAISDPEGTKVIVQNIRMVSQSVHLIVRTRFVREIP